MTFGEIGRRVKRRLLGSVLGKIVAGLLLLIVAINVSNVVGLRYITKLSSDNFFSQLDNTTESTLKVQVNSLNALGNFIFSIPETNELIPQRLSEGNYDDLSAICAEEMKGMRVEGYIITDTEGTVVSTSYEMPSQERLDSLSKAVAYLLGSEEKGYDGYMDLFDNGVSLVSIRILADVYHNDAVVVILVQRSVENLRYLSYVSRSFHAVASVYRNGKCTVSTMPDSILGSSFVGSSFASPWVADSISTGSHKVLAVDRIGDHKFFSSYVPMCDYGGRVLGVYAISLDGSTILDGLGSVYLLFGLCTLAIAIFVFVIAIYFRRTLTKPLSQLTKDAQRISNCDVSQKVYKARTVDEVSTLSVGMENMRLTLRDSILEFVNASKMLHAASEELSRASNELSDGANKQAASLEEISSSLEEMTSTIHQNTDSAYATEQMMKVADEAVVTVSETAQENKNDTQKISESIRAINDLVSQTNILSLNASVEAARAGNAGRGFAVVAKEVGRLADQTKDTAAEVTDTANKSINGAEQISTMLGEVAPKLHEMVSLVRQITVSSREQGIGADQINSAISNLNKATQENAANAEEVAANAEELSATASKMRDIINRFKV